MEDEDASPEAAMRRELLEETGYVFSELYATSIVSSNPDKCTNLVHSFLAVAVSGFRIPSPARGNKLN